MPSNVVRRRFSRKSTKTAWTDRRGDRSRSGQALVESALVIVVISLLFFGLFQLSQLFAARQVLEYATFAAARSRTVGFNRWIVDKAFHVAAIPASGLMESPESGLRPREQLSAEISAIPAYLQSYYPSDALGDILDYEDWDELEISAPLDTGALLEVGGRLRYPLRLPMHRAFYAADEVRLSTEAVIDNHFPVYLDVD